MRIRQRDILPSAVKSRNLSSIIYGSEAQSAQTTLGNNEQALVTSTLSSDRKYEIMAIPYFTIYIGSVADANILPGGASIDESQWQVIGPYYNYDTWESLSFARDKEPVTLYVRNISAGAGQVVIFYIKWRYISPREQA